MPDLNPEEVEKLLTSSELKLVEASQKPAVTKLSEAQLKKKITLTRKARDKWKDLATRQRREKQRSQGSRVTDAAARSADKSKVLSQALSEFQSQLGKIESGEAVSGSKSSSPKRPAKKKRAAGHRESRAEVRAQLEEKRAKLDAGEGGGSPTKKKAAKKKVAKKPISAKSTPAKKTAKKKAAKKTSPKKSAAKKVPTKKTTSMKSASKQVATKSDSTTSESTEKKSVTKKKPTKKPTLASNRMTSGLAAKLNLNPADQRSSKTKAKKARIQQSGLTSRTRGHISARGKRSQGRRDSRG